jgi:hypothetical protein
LKENDTHLDDLDEIPQKYGIPVESVRVRQLNVGDFLNLKTKSGSKYIFRVDGKAVDDEGERILVSCIFGPEKMKDSSGKVDSNIIMLNEKFRYGRAKTNEITQIIVSKMPVLTLQSQVALNTSILEIEVKQLQIGHIIYAVSKNDTVYILEIFDRSEASDEPHVKIIGGNSNFVGDMGYLKNMVIGVGMNLKTDMMNTTPLKYLEIRAGEGARIENPKTKQQSGEIDVSANQEDQMSGIICINLTKEETDTLKVLNLTTINLTLGKVRRAWQKYMQEYNEKLEKAMKVRNLNNAAKFRLEIEHAIISLGYEALLARLGEKQEEK